MAQMRFIMAAPISRAAIFFCALGVSSLAQASLFADDEARRALIDLRVQVEALSTKITDLERRLQSATQGQLNLLNENERLRAELASLRGQIEEANKVVTTGKSQQKDLYTDLDQRLRQIEPVALTIEGITYRVSPDEKSRFDELRELLRTGDFKKSIAATLAFEQSFPQSMLSPHVLLIKGTALYADKDYKGSIAARQDFIERYPNHPGRPQATLNMAASQAESGNPNTARGILEGLIKAYPNSPAAAEAKERLKALPKAAAPAPAKAPPPKAAPKAQSK